MNTNKLHAQNTNNKKALTHRMPSIRGKKKGRQYTQPTTGLLWTKEIK